MSIINTAIINKLRKIKANVADVLLKTNTEIYVPSEEYHPATKKYVDDLISTVSAKDDVVYTSFIETTSTTILSSAPLTKTIKYFVQAVNSVTNEVYTSEINILNDNTDIYLSEHSIIYSGESPFVSFGAIVLGNEVTLTVTATTDDPITIKFIRNILEDFPEIALSEGYDDVIISSVNKSNTTFINYEIISQDTATDNLHKSNIIMIWDGSNVTSMEKNVIFTGSNPVASYTFDDANASYIRLKATPNQDDQTLYRVARIYGSTTFNTTTTESTDADQVIEEISASSFRSVFYTIRVSDSSSSTYQYIEFTATHDETDVYLSEHSKVSSDGDLVEFDVIINSGNIQLIGTPSTSNELTYQIVKKLIDL